MKPKEFRCWNPNTKQMIYDINLDNLSRLREEIRGIVSLEMIYDWKDLIWMEWTGLVNEKTKKKVFEGDIFREEKETDQGDIRSYSVVTWIKERAAYYLIPSEHYQIIQDNDCENEEEFEWLFQDAALYDFSIGVNLALVGNIYQNPKLLKS